MAEGEGFEPSVPYWTRRLSRAVHSTTLPPFREHLTAFSEFRNRGLQPETTLMGPAKNAHYIQNFPGCVASNALFLRVHG